MVSNNIIEELVERARRAVDQVAIYDQSQADDICLAVGWSMYCDENIRVLARMAVEETGMGNENDKIAKHKGKVLGVMSDIQNAKSVGLIERDDKRGIRKYAKPVGVVAALCPVTNPTATPASNAISILKGRNAVIFAPHPRAKQSTAKAIEFMRSGLKSIGAPEDLVQVISDPSLTLTCELMEVVDLVVATGGAAMVKAAYSSGTPSYGVGPGNSCQIIAEDADIPDVIEKLFMSKVFDYATSCSSENSIIIHEQIFDELIDGLISRGAYRVNKDERDRLKNSLWQPSRNGRMVLNSALICKDAGSIAKAANISVSSQTEILLVDGLPEIEDDPFAGEKLSPVLTFYTYREFDTAVQILKKLTNSAGTGHSCGIHTFNESYIDRVGTEMCSSRILVRQPQAQGNGGNFFNGLPSTVTLGCGTWGGNITTENIHYKHFLNVTWLSTPIERPRPTDEDIWGAYLDRYSDKKVLNESI